MDWRTSGMQKICSKERIAAQSAPYPVSETGSAYRSTLDSLELNGRPAFWSVLPFAVAFAAASAFLEVYVVSSAQHVAVFLVGSYVVFSSYFTADYMLARISTSYARIKDDQKFYVLSNLIKSAVLTTYTPQAAFQLYDALVNDVWSTDRIRSLGVLYAIPDFVSMLLVQRMALTTKAHHVCVVAFMILCLYTDFAEETVLRAVVVYAVFSTFAYLVNLLLASRFLPVGARLSLIMSALALGIYTSCLALNWSWQVFFLTSLHSRRPSVSLYVYVAAMSFVVYDDIVLTRWLISNVRRKWREVKGTAEKSK